jgi:hypothetical protein
MVMVLPAAALPAQTVSAEPWFRHGTWMLSADVGGAAFTDFQRATARTMPGETAVGDFRRRVSAGTTVTMGGSATYWLGEAAGVRAALAWAPTRFSVRNAGEAQRVLNERDEAEREPYARLDVWMGSASLVFRLPMSLRRLVPYGIVGGGAVHLRMAEGALVPPEARRRFEGGSWTGPAAVFGLGATLPLQRRNLLMSFELTNHLTPTPLDDQGRGEQFELGGIPFELERDSGRNPDGIGLTNNLRLTLGLTLPLR